VLADARQASPVDVVFLAVKAHQTQSASEWLDSLTGPSTTVFVLQNGVEHVERVTPHVAANTTVVPVVVNCPAMRSRPGTVIVHARSALSVPSDVADAHMLTDTLAESFIEPRLLNDWITAAWRKLMLNAVFGGLCAIGRTHSSAICADPTTRAMALVMLEEVAVVGWAEGANLAPDAAQAMLTRVADAHSTYHSSIVVDRLAGRPTEWDARDAVVARIASTHGIEVPTNDLMTSLLLLGEPK
jgi:2-dehydropantoate 2-reductase